MVVEILETGPSAAGALNYSEKKFSKQEASVCLLHGIPRDNAIAISDTFERYESNPEISGKTKNLVLHLAFNPSEKDTSDEDQIFAFIREYMERIGYADQPYVVYRHNDIVRQHYHLVSPKVDLNGRVIRCNFEGGNWDRFITVRLVQEIGPKYGIYPAEKGERTKLAAGIAETDIIPDRYVREQMRFIPTASRQSDNLRFLFREALSYDFTTRQEFNDILSTMGLSWPDRKGFEETVRLQGRSTEGEKTTKVIPFEHTFLPGAYRLFLSRRDENEAEAERVAAAESTPDYDEADALRAVTLAAIISYCLAKSASYEEFRKRLSEAGLTLVCHREDGPYRKPAAQETLLPPIKSLTLIDPKTHAVLSGRRLTRVLDPARLLGMESSGVWPRVRREIPKGTQLLSAEDFEKIENLIRLRTEEFYRQAPERRGRNHDLSHGQKL